VGLVETILGGLKSLSGNQEGPAIALQVQKLPIPEAKAIKAKVEATPKAKVEAPKEETPKVANSMITIEEIRALAMAKSTSNPEAKAAIKKMLNDLNVANIPSLPESAYEEFYAALNTL